MRASRGAYQDVGIQIARRHASECKHTRQTIDEVLRVVTCIDCHATLDPIETMLGWARNWNRLADSVTSLRAEVAQRRQEIERLKAERAQIKAGIRRASR